MTATSALTSDLQRQVLLLEEDLRARVAADADLEGRWKQEQSLALSLIIGDREKDGWDDDRLVPLVAGLAELQPWVKQWHGEVDPDYGVSLAAFCQEQLIARAAQVGKTLDELAAWRTAPATRGRGVRSAE